MPFVDNILQPTHLLLILVVALLVLGPKRLPEAGRALGNGIRDFRSAISGEHQQSEPHEEIVSQASSVEATQPKEPAQPPAEPVQPVG
jgi:sec-independent protein translocase protein TatA